MILDWIWNIACFAAGVYAVIDLYGQCAQVTLSSGLTVEQSTSEVMVNTSRPLEQSMISTRSTGLVLFDFVGFVDLSECA